MSAHPLPIGASGMGIDIAKIIILFYILYCLVVEYDFIVRFNIIKCKYIKECATRWGRDIAMNSHFRGEAGA